MSSSWMNEQQRSFYLAMTNALKLCADPWQASGSRWTFLRLWHFSWQAGHGKVVISSYMIANETALRRGIFLSRSFLSLLQAPHGDCRRRPRMVLAARHRHLDEPDSALWRSPVLRLCCFLACGCYAQAKPLLFRKGRMQALARPHRSLPRPSRQWLPARHGRARFRHTRGCDRQRAVRLPP